jgi:hypothetical protein
VDFDEVIIYTKANIYYIMYRVNAENSKEFVNKLESIPNIGDTVMGNIAHKFIEEGKIQGKA